MKKLFHRFFANYKHIYQKYVGYFVCSIFSTAVQASSTGGPTMPWDTGLQKIQDTLTGSTAHALIVIAIAATGVAVAIGEHGSIFRKGASIVFGGSIAMGAVSLYSTLQLGGAIV